MRAPITTIARVAGAGTILLGGMAMVVLLGLFGLSLMRFAVEDRRRIETPRGIESTETVMLGGIPQVVNIRGQDRANPVLLFLHGGPGTPMLPFAHAFQDPWEDHFTVVHWDQRGTGLTAGLTPPDALAGTVSFDRMLADTLELSEYLGQRFGQERIVLLGHSWGSMLGLAAVAARPDLYSVYVGTGQAIHPMESERRGYAHVLAVARERGNARAVAALEALAPYPAPRPGAEPEGVAVRHAWTARFGGAVYGYTSLGRAMLPHLAISPDYGPLEAWHVISADGTVYTPLMDAITGFDACDFGQHWAVPIVLVVGSADWQVNHQLARDWFDWIDAR